MHSDTEGAISARYEATMGRRRRRRRRELPLYINTYTRMCIYKAVMAARTGGQVSTTAAVTKDTCRVPPLDPLQSVTLASDYIVRRDLVVWT